MLLKNTIKIKGLEKDIKLTLHKVNREIIGSINKEYLISITRKIDDIDELELSIPRYIEDRFTLEKIRNVLYNDIKDERIICLNDNDYFVIKEDDLSSTENEKVIKAFSLEYKLGKIDINVEDIGFYLITKDEEKGIYSLNDYMKQETGWALGYVDDTVRFEVDEKGKQIEKMRWQESISRRWYDFLMDDIAKGFGCIISFDTKHKLVNLFDVNTSSEEIQIYLSKDNYIKDIGRNTSSSDIVTRLFLVGNEELDIIGSTSTGYPYIENYSYFIENNEMSKELIQALITYESRVREHNIEWERVSTLKLEKTSILDGKQYELYIIYEEIKAKKSILKSAKTDEDKAKINAEITKLNDQKVILENEVQALEDKIINLQSSIDRLNILCKRETATDINGYLIFDEYLLDELKEFVYCETYTNDMFRNADDLIKAGERELELKCKPTISYTLNVVDFTKRIIDNGFRQHWKGELNLGDIIMLYDEETEQESLHFLTEYTLDPSKNDGLDITISNKKVRNDNTRDIADYLQSAKRSLNMVNTKKYLWNKQKYNRINL